MKSKFISFELYFMDGIERRVWVQHATLMEMMA